MRRLVIEIPLEDTIKLEREESLSLLRKIRSVEVLHFLRHDPKEFAVITKVELTDQQTRIKDVMNGVLRAHGDNKSTEIQLLERDKNGITYMFFLKGKVHQSPFYFDLKSQGGYFTTPFELKDGNLRLTFLGNSKETKELLKSLNRSRIRHRVIMLTDAKFSPHSPLSVLTEKQRRVLITAYCLGYYDRPRKISSEELARKLNLVSSTFVAHRQKAERRLLSAILDRA